MILRFLNAVILGMLVGIVLYEGLLAAYGLFFPGHDVMDALMHDHRVPVSTAAILVSCWMCGATASTLMAGGLAGNRLAAACCALCWMMPQWLLISVGRDPSLPLVLPVVIGALAWLLSLRFMFPLAR